MNTILLASVIRETEKAILVDAMTDTHCGRGSAQIWLPKSQVKALETGYIEVPEWLLGKKAAEVTSRGFIGFVTVDHVPTAEEKAARVAAEKAAEAARIADLKAVMEEGRKQREAAKLSR